MFDYLLRKPTANDDKYSRGVVGFITGSEQFAGAAILGVTAAIRAGVGMVRYVGPSAPSQLVLEARPEAVLGLGRVQSWVLGSGVSSNSQQQIEAIKGALSDSTGELLVIDAGALELIEANFAAGFRSILTPHEGEARRLLERLSGQANHSFGREKLITEIQKITGCTVLLKGSQTLIADSDKLISCPLAPAELATAGTGDVLAGVLGALLAINHHEVLAGETTIAQVAEAAVAVHSESAILLVDRGPIAALDLADHVGQAVVALRSK